MKSKIYFIKQFVLSDIFKLILAIIIISAFMSLALYIPELITNVDTTNYIDRLCFVISHKTVMLFTIPFIIILLVIYLIKIFDYYQFYFIRFKTKKAYHKLCIKNIIACYTLTYILFLLIFSILHLLLKTNTFLVTNYHISGDYYVINIIYLFWLILKNYLLSIFYIIINYLLLKIFNNKVVIAMNIIFIGSILILNRYDLGFYLIYNFILTPYFVNFDAELFSFMLNSLISILSLLFIYEILEKYMKVLSE